MSDSRADTTTSTSSADTGSGGRLSGATDRVRDAASTARSRASDAYGSARERASGAYSTTRQTASQGLEDNPLAMVAGGLALGVIAGALLPRTQKETQVLGQVGRQINETAREAFNAARQAGTEELGLSRDAAKSQAQTLMEKAQKAATTAGGAALQAAKAKSGGGASGGAQTAAKDPFAGPSEY